MLKGLKERIEHEVWDLLNPDPSKPLKKISVYTDSHRRYATWIGGSMLASMSTFGEFKISQHAYKEAGNKFMVLKKGF